MKSYIYKHKKLLVINIILMFLMTLTDILLALGLKEIVDSGVNKNIDKFNEILIYAIIFVILNFSLDYVGNVMKAKYINKTFLSLKRVLFNRLIQKDIMSFRKQNISHYISMFTNDITILEEDYFNAILELIYQSFRLITATITIVVINPYLLLTVIVVSVLPILIPNLFSKKVSQYKKEFSDSLSNFTMSTKEFLSGYDVIKSFNIEGKIQEKYSKANDEVERTKYKFKVISSFVTTLSSVSGFLMFLVVIVVGTYMVINNIITVGSLIASVQLMNYIVSPLGYIAEDINKIKSVKKISEKFKDLLSDNEFNNNNKYGIEKVKFNNKIEFKNVSFSYKRGKDIVKNVSFSINKGGKYAIVGSSGSGKTTILKLLLRYFDNFDGEISIDGIDIRELKVDSLYQLISVIQQEVFMFDSSIKENIALFNDYPIDYIEDIAEKAGLSSLINSLDNGLNTHVGESGCNLSGGERQRIAIARALIKNTPILVLDEATSSLDNETAYRIEKLLIDIKELTTLVVTHKLIGNILEKYDGIIAIKNGRIKEIGTFQELMDKKGYFYSLYTIEGHNI